MTTMDCHVSSTKRGVILDGNEKMGVSSMKMAVFVDGSGMFVIFA